MSLVARHVDIFGCWTLYFLNILCIVILKRVDSFKNKALITFCPQPKIKKNLPLNEYKKIPKNIVIPHKGMQFCLVINAESEIG